MAAAVIDAAASSVAPEANAVRHKSEFWLKKCPLCLVFL
jgi:hypothetical protein